jgi:hypothetical protein
VALPDKQPDRFRCFKNALRNWNSTGYVIFKRIAADWLVRELGDPPLKDIAKELYLCVRDGGTIEEQKERRPEWDDHDFHFDLRVKIAGRLIYFETLLFCDDPDDPDDPYIKIVSIRDV